MGQRFRIHNEINRASSENIVKLSSYQVANLGDTLDRLACIPASKLFPLNNNKLAGPAYTVKTVGGDNLMIYYALNNAKEGDVLVIDAEANNFRAVVGEILVNIAVQKKLAGIVVNGAVRDSEALREIDIPVYATGISPNGPYKNGPGEINSSIAIEGITINPGDIIIGDYDGIIVIKDEEADKVLEEVKKIEEKEKKHIK